MTTPEPSIRISLGEIYREVRKLRDVVRPMAGDLRDLRESAHDFRDDVESRLRSLEAARFPWKVIAGIAALVGILGTLVALLSK